MTNIIDTLSKIGTIVDSKTGKQGLIRQFNFKYLGLYFTATWCSYCVQIVDKIPVLLNKVNSKSDLLKLITLRLDEDSSNFGFSYLRYKTISYEQVSSLAVLIGARSIPSIYVYDIMGRLISRNGLEDMSKHQERTVEYWDNKIKQQDNKAHL